MRGQLSEVVEVMSRCTVGICRLHEMRWRGATVRLVEEKYFRYKMFCLKNDKGMGGVGILLAEKRVEVVFDVKPVSGRIVFIKIVAGKSIVTVLLAYAPQAGLDDTVKDLFYENLQWTLTKISDSEILFVCGVFNGHIGKKADEYE